MRIDHDKESGALYIRFREGRYDHTEDFSERADVYLDLDAGGNVLGLEALSFEDLAIAVEERGGKLDVPERLDPDAYEGEEGRPGVGSVRDAISLLPPDDREVLRLRYFEGLTMSEAADSLGVSYAVARSRHRMSLRRLLTLIEEQDPGTVDVAELEALLSRS